MMSAILRQLHCSQGSVHSLRLCQISGLMKVRIAFQWPLNVVESSKDLKNLMKLDIRADNADVDIVLLVDLFF